MSSSSPERRIMLNEQQSLVIHNDNDTTDDDVQISKKLYSTHSFVIDRNQNANEDRDR